MDRKAQVRRIVAAKYPQLSASEQNDLIEFIWKEADRANFERREQRSRYPG